MKLPREFWTMPQSQPPREPFPLLGGFLRGIYFSPVLEMDAVSAYPTATEHIDTADTEDLEFMVVYPNQRVVYHTGLTVSELADYLTENEAWLPGQRFTVYRKPRCSDDTPEHVATIGLHDKPYAIMWCGQ